MPARVIALILLFAGSAHVVPQQTAPPSVEDERARWNRVFTNAPPNIRTEANLFLVQVAQELEPGTALDIGMGFGRNALYLARRGWTVTGVDISDVGVEKARARAAAEKLPLTTVREDMFKYDYGRNRYDLVVFMYMGGEARGMADLITNALKPGGLLVIEHFLKEPGGRLGYEAAALPKLYPKLDVLKYMEAGANPDYDQRTKGRVVRFLARKPA